MAGDNLRWLEHLPQGWHPLYRDLVTALEEVDPDIVISEAKQKLGWLRVYLQKSQPQAESLVRAAETRSRTTCELCGASGELRVSHTGWHRTLCDAHGAGFRPTAIGRNVTVPASEMPSAIQLDEAILPWPLFTLDFEASGLGEFTYPIEIGIARWVEPDAPISSWSVMIKPTKAWLRHRIWMPESEKIHGISRDELDQGVSPRWALEHANALLRDHVVYCDGGEHDVRWLRHLTHAARIRPTFELADWGQVVGLLSANQRSSMAQWQTREAPRHRAGEDAPRLLRSLAAGLSKRSGQASDISSPRVRLSSRER